MNNTQEAWLRSTGETWFESCGQILFPVYNLNGSVSTAMVALITKRDGDKYLATPVTLTLADKNISYEELKDRIKTAKENWTEFDPNGGSLPLPAKGMS